MCNCVCWYLAKIPGQRDWVFDIAPEDDPILGQNVLGQLLLAVHVDHISCKSDHGLSTQRSYSSVFVISSYKEQDIRVYNLKACARGTPKRICSHSLGHQGLKRSMKSNWMRSSRVRTYRPMGASGAVQTERHTVSPGGLLTAALQHVSLISLLRPNTALVPYCSSG